MSDFSKFDGSHQALHWEHHARALVAEAEAERDITTAQAYRERDAAQAEAAHCRAVLADCAPGCDSGCAR